MMHKKVHKYYITTVDDFKVFHTISYIFSFPNLIQFKYDLIRNPEKGVLQ